MLNTEFLAHFNSPSCGEHQPCSGNGCHHLSLEVVHTYLIVGVLVQVTDGRLWRMTAVLGQNHIGTWASLTEMVLVPSATGEENWAGLTPPTL